MLYYIILYYFILYYIILNKHNYIFYVYNICIYVCIIQIKYLYIYQASPIHNMPLLGLTPALSQDLPAFISSGYKRSFPRLSNFFMVAFTAWMVQVPEDILCWVVGFIRNIYIYIILYIIYYILNIIYYILYYIYIILYI